MIRFSIVLGLLLYSALFTQAASVDTVQIFSEVMQRDIPAVVVTPDSYETNADQRFPVVYLLHGYSGNYADWITKAPEIQTLADYHQLVLVCPDGGYDSWYLDSPVNDSSQYETYVAEEVISYVDSAYRTINEPNARAITGLSMGGHGALFLALRHTDTFGAAGSMSGGVDLTYSTNSWGIKDQLGPYEQNPLRWDSLSVVNMVHELPPEQLALIIDCGADDFFFRINGRLHEILLEQQIPHDYIVRPGAHNWSYWENAVSYQLLFFRQFFEENKPVMSQSSNYGQ